MGMRWEGMSELRKEIRGLPPLLAQKAEARVTDAAGNAATALRDAYPAGPTGGLRRGVRVTSSRRKSLVVATVISSAPEAHLWEFGTQVRRTQRGWNRGAEPAHYNQGIVGIAIRYRRLLLAQLIAIVEEQGLPVTGDV